MQSIIWKILLICFIIDVLRKRFEKPIPAPPSSQPSPQAPSASPSPPEEELPEIDTSLDEDEDTKDDLSSSSSSDDDDDDIINNVETASTSKQHKRKRTKRVSWPPTPLHISYCKHSYEKFLNQFKLDLIGNFSNIEVTTSEYPLPAFKQMISKITMFTQFGVSILLFTGSKMKDSLTFIPSSVFEYIEKNKWMVIIGNFMLHQFLNNFAKTSSAFEVTTNGVVLWSKLQKKVLPKIKDIEYALTANNIDIKYTHK